MWLAKPSPELENPVENCYETSAGAPAGGTPDFSTVYFGYPGTLLPEDAARTPHAGTGAHVESWGFYEEHEGVMHEAGVLPDGPLDRYGAVPRLLGMVRTVSATRSPKTARARSSSAPTRRRANRPSQWQNDCAVDPPELYVREDGDKTVLVSRDTLLPKLGAASIRAHWRTTDAQPDEQDTAAGLSGDDPMFASPDGSQAFFQSEEP